MKFSVLKLDALKDYSRPWASFSVNEIRSPGPTTYGIIVEKFCGVKAIKHSGFIIYKRSVISDTSVPLEVNEADSVDDECVLAVWFKNKSTPKRPRGGSSSSTDACPADESCKKNLDNALNESSTSSEMSNTADATLVKKESNPLPNPFAFPVHPEYSAKPFGSVHSSDLPYYNASSDVYGFLNEWLGRSKKEGNVSGHMIRGHVSARFMRQATAIGGAVTGVCAASMQGTCTLFSDVKNENFAILTNHHILKTEAEADQCVVYMDHENDCFQYDDERANTLQVVLSPRNMFITNEDLDYSFVAVDPICASVLKPRQTLRMNDLSQGVARFAGINLVSHPRGRACHYSIRGTNYLTDANGAVSHSNFQDLIRHGAYSLDGSSGGILFDDDWKPLALHTAKGDEVRNQEGQLLKVDEKSASGSSIYVDGIDNPDDVLYRCNESTKLSAIVDNMKAQNLEAIERFL